MTQPWDKFFWSDYASDPALKLCSFAAQGLWMRMLCIAAEHEPKGYVAVNGRGLDIKEIARATGGDSTEVAGLIVELDGNGVFSRDRRGWIYSRRMKNEVKKREIAAQNGKKGGNPRLRKHDENSAQDNQQLNGEDKGQSNPHIPEARSQSSSVDKSTGAEGAMNDPESPDFDPVKALFDDGVRCLGRSGTPEKSARSLLGRWRREYGDDAVALGIAAAEARNISQPVEWLPKWLASRAEREPQRASSKDFDLVEHINANPDRWRGSG